MTQTGDTKANWFTGKQWFACTLVLITVIGGVLRLYRLDAPSFWIDELRTVEVGLGVEGFHKSKMFGYWPTHVALKGLGVDIPSLRTSKEQKWRALGVTEWNARIASCLIGTISIPLLFAASCPVLGQRRALILSILLAASPWHIYWSQTARFYTLQFLFYNLALFLYLRATMLSSRRNIAPAFLCALLAFLSQPTALVIVVVLAADWLMGLARGKPVRLGARTFVLAGVLLAFCMVLLISDVARKPEDWTKFAVKLSLTPTGMIFGTIYMVHPMVVFMALGAVPLVVRRETRLTLCLLCGAVLPLVVFSMVAWRGFAGTRYAFVSMYCWLAIAAMGLDRLYEVAQPRTARALASVPSGMVLIALMLVNLNYFTCGYGFRPRWREAFEYVAAHSEPGDPVYCYPSVGRYYLEHEVYAISEASQEGLADLGCAAWFVRVARDVVEGRQKHWIEDKAELKAYYDVRAMEPYYSVRVYKMEPQTGSNTSQ